MKKISLFLSVVIAAVTITGCKIDGNDALPQASFRVVHASPNAPNLDVYLNGFTAATNLAYDSSTKYAPAGAGNYQLRVATTGTATYLIDAGIGLEAGRTYSIYTIDSLSKIRAVATRDDFTVPPSDSIRLRFLHFSTNTGLIDLTDGTNVLFAGRGFNDQFLSPSYASYINLPAGTYNFEITPSGAPAVIYSMPGTVLAGGKVYTFYAKGFSGGSGSQAFGVGILTDYPQ